MLETNFTSIPASNNTVNTDTVDITNPTSGSVVSNVTFNNASSRTISFTISSSPNGASIFINDVDSGFITPHTMMYSETELLTPKIIYVKNGSAVSGETYVISSELVTQTTDGTSPTGQDGYNPSIPTRPTGSAIP